MRAKPTEAEAQLILGAALRNAAERHPRRFR
jgi:hypothetical protein